MSSEIEGQELVKINLPIVTNYHWMCDPKEVEWKGAHQNWCFQVKDKLINHLDTIHGCKELSSTASADSIYQLPEKITQKNWLLEWLQLHHQSIRKYNLSDRVILAKGHNDIAENIRSPPFQILSRVGR